MLTSPSWLEKQILPGMVWSLKPSCVHRVKMSLDARIAEGDIIVSTMLTQ
jgi:hypothetical protein